MRHKEDYIARYKNARAGFREILKLAQGNATIHQPWRMKDLLDQITGWDDVVIASIKSRTAGEAPAHLRRAEMERQAR